MTLSSSPFGRGFSKIQKKRKKEKKLTLFQAATISAKRQERVYFACCSFAKIVSRKKYNKKTTPNPNFFQISFREREKEGMKKKERKKIVHKRLKKKRKKNDEEETDIRTRPFFRL